MFQIMLLVSYDSIGANFMFISIYVTEEKKTVIRPSGTLLKNDRDSQLCSGVSDS